MPLTTTCSSCGLASPLPATAEAACPRCGAALGGAEPDAVDRALELARRELDMDLAFFGEVANGQEIIRRTAGDPVPFDLHEGQAIPLDETICERVLARRLSGVLPDVRRDAGLRRLTRGRIGAYIGVPFSTGDARRYMLCCLAGQPRPGLEDGDLRFLHGLSATIVAALRGEGSLPAPG